MSTIVGSMNSQLFWDYVGLVAVTATMWHGIAWVFRKLG